MAQPTAGDVHVNMPLTNVSVAWAQANDKFVAGKFFPNVPVNHQSNLYYVYDRGDWYRTEAAIRAPCAESAGSGWTLSTDQYFAKVWAVHKDISDQVRSNADPSIDMDRDASEFVAQQMLIRKDKEFRDNYFQAGIWGTDFDVTNQGGGPWSDAANATPITDIRTNIHNVESATGYRPRGLLLGANSWRAMQDTTDFIERIKHTQLGVTTLDLVARVLGLDFVMVAGSVANDAPEGAPDATSYIMGNGALLAYVAPSPGLLRPSAGYNFTWTGLTGAQNDFGMRIKRFRDEKRACDRVEAECAFAMKQVASELGVFFTNTI